METSDEELAKLLVPETMRHQIGLVHPVAAAKLIVEAYRIGYRAGWEGREDALKKSRKRKR